MSFDVSNEFVSGVGGWGGESLMSLNKVVVVKGMPNDNWHIIIPKGPLYDLKWVWSICICNLKYRKKLNHNILKYVTLSRKSSLIIP